MSFNIINALKILSTKFGAHGHPEIRVITNEVSDIEFRIIVITDTDMYTSAFVCSTDEIKNQFFYM